MISVYKKLILIFSINLMHVFIIRKTKVNEKFVSEQLDFRDALKTEHV